MLSESVLCMLLPFLRYFYHYLSISINFPVPFFRLSFLLFVSFISFSSAFLVLHTFLVLSPTPFFPFYIRFFFGPFSPRLYTQFFLPFLIFHPVFLFSPLILFMSVNLFSLPPTLSSFFSLIFLLSVFFQSP